MARASRAARVADNGPPDEGDFLNWATTLLRQAARSATTFAAAARASKKTGPVRPDPGLLGAPPPLATPPPSNDRSTHNNNTASRKAGRRATQKPFASLANRLDCAITISIGHEDTDLREVLRMQVFLELSRGSAGGRQELRLACLESLEPPNSTPLSHATANGERLAGAGADRTVSEEDLQETTSVESGGEARPEAGFRCPVCGARFSDRAR
ncbi:hypothetical protein HPB52_012861 [Rhipicephalus sanguineus]|uniref:Uncharacterized protein n=1 Tax=Rhipicephalus sanguineus TaxID=34632 RepID=A0A9D4PW73_RHISA|nr:hypothetical protein HPB52_012861 [Rhipicephalus sanguineus]